MGTKRNKLVVLVLMLLALGQSELTAQQTERIFLSGIGADDSIPWDFYCSAGRNSGKWTTIDVPSCWEQQGFGEYNYGHVPFEERLKETGTYKREFRVPKNWKNKEVSIVFEGVMTDASVKINGKSVGPTHQGGFYEFRYPIKRFLRFGEKNTIEVLVKKFSDDRSVSLAERSADYWVFGGIFRPVYLESKPKNHIQRVAIDAKADGSFIADIYTSTLGRNHQVETSIQTLEGEIISTFVTDINEAVTRVADKVVDPFTWNPETPLLYKAVFKITSKDKVLHSHTERFGFRTVEIRESDGIYVNGTKIKFKGVNRHTFHPDHGRTSSKTMSIQAVKLMKEMNMNAVRMSHYPPDKHFLDVCDSLGLFVLDELAGWQRPAYDTQVGRRLLKEMVSRDVNHPSIILWDNGNENGWNKELDNDFPQEDIQQREVIHPRENFEKTNTIHYVDYDYLSLDGYGKRKIFFPTELLHGLYDGGHGASLEDFWSKIWNHPLAAGAFLWVFADEGVARTDKNGAIDLDGNHAPDGILGPYLEKEASFYTIKKIWSPIFVEKRYITPQFNGVLNIENRYHFTNLDQVEFLVEWIAYDLKGESTVISSENLTIALKPGQKGQLKMALPGQWNQMHLLRVTARTQTNDEIAAWTYPVQKAAKVVAQLEVKKEQHAVDLEQNADSFHATVGNIAYTFDKDSGALLGVKKSGIEIPLTNGPTFVSRNKVVEKVNAEQLVDGTVKITVRYVQDGGTIGGDMVTWHVRADGTLSLDVIYEPANKAPFAGISFTFPEGLVSGMQWMGRGPQRVWKNRMEGPQFGVWEKKFNNTMTGHSHFDYPEFKGYHAEVYWAKIRTNTGQGFKVTVKSDDVYLRMFTPDQPEDPRYTAVEFPVGDISFLHGINAIGTKFNNTASLGPQSSGHHFHPNNYDGEKLKMELVFDFEE